VSSTAAEVTTLSKGREIPRERALVAAIKVDRVAHAIARWGLVAILLAFGLFKFTAAEAAAIRPMGEHSPFLGWLYWLFSTQGASNFIGVMELTIAVLLAAHRWAPRTAVVGGVWASGMFLITLSFLVTTPGVLKDPSAFGFLVKDLFLLAAALGATAESLRVDRRSSSPGT